MRFIYPNSAIAKKVTNKLYADNQDCYSFLKHALNRGSLVIFIQNCFCYILARSPTSSTIKQINISIYFFQTLTTRTPLVKIRIKFSPYTTAFIFTHSFPVKKPPVLFTYQMHIAAPDYLNKSPPIANPHLYPITNTLLTKPIYLPIFNQSQPAFFTFLALPLLHVFTCHEIKHVCCPTTTPLTYNGRL